MFSIAINYATANARLSVRPMTKTDFVPTASFKTIIFSVMILEYVKKIWNNCRSYGVYRAKYLNRGDLMSDGDYSFHCCMHQTYYYT